MFNYFKSLFNIDPISLLMIFLVSVIGILIGSFASRFMEGDTRYKKFFLYLALLMVSIGTMVCSDHIGLFFISWCLSNLFLVRLMIHKKSWVPALKSGVLAGKNFILGALCIGAGLAILSLKANETSIRALITTPFENYLLMPALFLLLIGAMTQSAIFPFHRWLISSLNSPTPVSALMHAGLVNGGGFLLIRFAPLYSNQTSLLTAIFLIGMTSALLGTFWKLMQSDVKRMLACSTMGQMGFMIAQCGLGLFSAAIAHLLTHGIFKAYLFLGSGSAAREKRHDFNYPPKTSHFILSLICGFIGSLCFSLPTGYSWLAGNTTLVLMIVSFVTASQFSLTILSLNVRFKIPIAIFVSSLMSFIYGSTVGLVKKSLGPIEFTETQTLNTFHFLGIALLVLSWLSVLFFKNTKKLRFPFPSLNKWYVKGLNASQPHRATVTTQRNNYKYL